MSELDADNEHPLLKGQAIDDPFAAEIADKLKDNVMLFAGLERDNYPVRSWLQGQLDEAISRTAALLLLTHSLEVCHEETLEETTDKACLLLKELVPAK